MKQSITIKLNAWIICAVLLIANLVTIGIWRPWEGTGTSDRTIVITGSTTIEAAPDQFVFSPYYQKEGTDKTVVNKELSDLSTTIVADSAIKTDVNSYEYSYYYGGPDGQATTALYITVTIKNKELAQKVQDYLVTTLPSGSVTPQILFSVEKQKVLETQARDAALANAKAKADSSATQLGARVGKVIKVSDMTSGGITTLPWMMNAEKGFAGDSVSSPSSTSSYTIQPGLNEYSFSVEVTYELN